MSSISTWVLSIAGVCVISVIADLMMSEGKMNKHVKSVISFAVILVVVLPLPKILNKELLTEDIFNNFDIEIQAEYIYNINQGKLESLKEQIEASLDDIGIIGVEVSISADIFASPMEINAVYVDLYNAVISDNNKNINIKTEVQSVVLKIINISKDKVVFNE